MVRLHQCFILTGEDGDHHEVLPSVDAAKQYLDKVLVAQWKSDATMGKLIPFATWTEYDEGRHWEATFEGRTWYLNYYEEADLDTITEPDPKW